MSFMAYYVVVEPLQSGLLGSRGEKDLFNLSLANHRSTEDRVCEHITKMRTGIIRDWWESLKTDSRQMHPLQVI